MARRVEEKSSSTWQRAAKTPTKLFANPVVLSENEIVISPYGKNEYLRKYNIEKDKFDPYIPYPTEVKINFHTIACDRDAGKIYLYDGSDKIFVEFDIHKQLVTKCKKKAKQSIVGNGKFSTSCVVNGSFHVIGGSEKDRHLIWDTMKQKFIEHEMIQPSPAGHSSILLSHSGGSDSLYKQIICFGGNDSIKLKKYLDTIYICDIHPEIQWKKLKNYKMPYKQYFFGCVLFQQSYILIFGGKQKDSGNKGNNGLSDEIWILHLKNWKWTRAHLKCPKKAKYYAVLTDNNIVHLFEYEGNGGHWKIPIEILINRSITRIRSESLSGQVKVLTDKLTDMNELNEELETSQKEYKRKIKELKQSNKQLIKDNKQLNNELETYKSKSTNKSNKSQPQTSLLKANDDYNSLKQKYQKLQQQMKSNTNTNGATNGSSNNTADNVLDIMNTVAPPPPQPQVQVQIQPKVQPIVQPIQTQVAAPVSNPFAADNDYDFWDYTNIIQWINALENGRYRKYISIMQQRLKQKNIDGHTFVNFKLNDLKNCGCTNYNDAVQLHAHMKKLKESNNDAFDTPTINNNNNAFNNVNVQPMQQNNNIMPNNDPFGSMNTSNNNNNNNNATKDLFDSLFN